jgi:hypothetical protein
MGRTACTEPQFLYKSALYYFYREKSRIICHTKAHWSTKIWNRSSSRDVALNARLEVLTDGMNVLRRVSWCGPVERGVQRSQTESTRTFIAFTASKDGVWRRETFYVLLIVHRGMILVNNQLDTQFFIYVYFYSLHVSGSHVHIIRRIIVSVRHLVYVTLCRWPSGMQEHMLLHTRRSSARSDINQESHWYNNSPDDVHMAARNM